jgi:hypothetical protein
MILSPTLSGKLLGFAVSHISDETAAASISIICLALLPLSFSPPSHQAYSSNSLNKFLLRRFQFTFS